MTLTPAVEVGASPPYTAAALHVDTLARPSFESRKTYRPDVINLENLSAEETPTPTQGEPPVVTKAYSLNIRKLNIKFAVVCLAFFLEGWNLGATGPLIPAIQKHYNVRLSSIQNAFFMIRLWADKLHSRIHAVSGSMYCKSVILRKGIRSLVNQLADLGIHLGCDVKCLPHQHKFSIWTAGRAR
jgi:hypothetical protein